MDKLLLLLYTGHYKEDTLRALASSNVLELKEEDIRRQRSTGSGETACSLC